MAAQPRARSAYNQERTFTEQVITAGLNIQAIGSRSKSAAGATLHNVGKTTTYLTDAANVARLREVRLERYRNLEAPPANTLLVVGRLAEPEFLIEIDVVAALPSR